MAPSSEQRFTDEDLKRLKKDLATGDASVILPGLFGRINAALARLEAAEAYVVALASGNIDLENKAYEAWRSVSGEMNDAKRLTPEDMWTKLTSEGGDYARTQYPLFKEIIQQACENGFAEAREKAAKVLEDHGCTDCIERIRAIEKDKPQ